MRGHPSSRKGTGGAVVLYCWPPYTAFAEDPRGQVHASHTAKAAGYEEVGSGLSILHPPQDKNRNQFSIHSVFIYSNKSCGGRWAVGAPRPGMKRWTLLAPCELTQPPMSNVEVLRLKFTALLLFVKRKHRPRSGFSIGRVPAVCCMYTTLARGPQRASSFIYSKLRWAPRYEEVDSPL